MRIDKLKNFKCEKVFDKQIVAAMEDKYYDCVYPDMPLAPVWVGRCLGWDSSEESKKEILECVDYYNFHS